MLSHKLIENVQRHCDQILDGLIARVRRDPELPHLRKLPEAELRDRGRAVLRYWTGGCRTAVIRRWWSNMRFWVGFGNKRESRSTKWCGGCNC